MKKILSLLLTGTLFAPTAPASAAVLTFDGPICSANGGPCTNASTIDATYGDIAGAIDVQYDNDINSILPVELGFWDFNYSDLTNVAWSAGSVAATAQVFLAPLGGQSVTLNGFDLGAWPNFSRATQVTIVDGLGATLFSSGPITVDGLVHSHFTGGYTSATGIGIQFGPDAINVGIDNIDFTLGRTGAVPEPASWALMIAGIGLVGGALRNRRGAFAPA